MDITNILNSKGPVAAAVAEQHLQQQLVVQSTHIGGRTLSDTASDRGDSPHASENSSRFSSRSSQPLQVVGNISNSMRYPSPTAMQQSHPMLQNGFVSNNLLENAYVADEPGEQGRPLTAFTVQKAFSCNTCGKGFARRSDLARHERIHSGIRPHVCDYPGCNKQFIQRSALTVHARVHTGEKPHMCERCGKPFSDSSSLARHRRIHSGKRPYKCPYADCQKTFTRRTTLTRHQNHHTGTVEEAAAATAAALASRPLGRPGGARSDGGTLSDVGSPQGTPSPNQRTRSLSPGTELPRIPNMQRQGSDYSYLTNVSVPPHMRADTQRPSPQPSPAFTSPSISSLSTNHHRPSLTSHPSGYGPPSILEPPTHQDPRQGGSGNDSPHMGSVGWQSPTHPGMASPSHNGPYVYPEPVYGASAHHLFYPNSNLRRPQSTEPENYETKPRLMNAEIWSAPVS